MKLFVKSPDLSKLHELRCFYGAIVSPVLFNTSIIEATPEMEEKIKATNMKVFHDIQFQPTCDLNPNWWEKSSVMIGREDETWKTKTQADVMKHIRADKANKLSTGKGVSVITVDTGVSDVKDFPNRGKSYGEHKNWSDQVGHGAMCSGIAVGSTKDGGKYNGVAPDATLHQAKTDFLSSELYQIYSEILADKQAGLFPNGVVTNNSYGHYTCSPPFEDENDHPYLNLIKECVKAGINIVFAAGNNHSDVCHYEAEAEGPNTIWSVNSIDEVISVGAVNWNNSNQEATSEHCNSSRGPGQFSKTKSKPDLVSACFGEVLWGSQYRFMPWWGTSGSTPCVVGCVAAILERNPTLTPAQVQTILRKTAKKLNAPKTCVGAGLLDCYAAVKSVKKV